ncbi:MAG: TIGR01777 family oxidoreductase [Anaerolineae bacterium]|nr:TIGR01777 family oxidoreductase [Anaerolineae bacterium]
MRAVITGGTGLIGQALSANMAADGYEVIVLSRTPAQAPAMPPGVHAAHWDARTAAGWGSLVDGADAVVNLAGASIARRWTRQYKQLIKESRLSAARAVVEAVDQATVKPRVLVQASGIGYYGPQGNEILTETSPPGEDFLARFAVEWENSTAAVETMGVRRTIIRSGAVLSTAGGSFPMMSLPFRFFVGGPLGSGRQWLPWIHIADEVAAIRFLIDNEEASGPFNLVAPDIQTNADFSRVLAQVMHRPNLFRVPAFAMRLLLGEMSVILLEGQRAAPQRLSDLGFTFRFPNLDAAIRNLLQKGEES